MCILGSVLLFLAEIVEIDVAEVSTKNDEIVFAAELCFLHYYISLHVVGTRGITYAWAT